MLGTMALDLGIDFSLYIFMGNINLSVAWSALSTILVLGFMKPSSE